MSSPDKSVQDIIQQITQRQDSRSRSDSIRDNAVDRPK